MVKTEIDIAFATSIIGRFANNKGLDHFSTMDQILKYLVNSQDRGITFEKNPKLCLVKYLDSDLAKDHFHRKLILRFFFTVNKRLVNYSLKKQVVVALFSIEVEYVALSLAEQKAI